MDIDYCIITGHGVSVRASLHNFKWQRSHEATVTPYSLCVAAAALPKRCETGGRNTTSLK